MLDTSQSPSDPDEVSPSAWFRALADKPRERLLRDGVAGLGDAELIALLLGTGTREQSVLQVAEHMIRTLGSAASLAASSPQELAQIRGVGQARAARIAAAFELGRRAATPRDEPITLRSAADIFALASRQLAHEPQELVLVIGVDAKNRWIDSVEIARGPAAAAISEPRSVFRPLLRMAATGGVVVHHQPASDLAPGGLTPGADDCSFARHLRSVGWVLGLPLVDHVIVTATGYCSLAEWLGTDF
jgi:DNA repair protein RadC